MKKNIVIIFMLLLLVQSRGAEHEKIAQSGFQFLSVISDAHAASMGGAVTTLAFNSAALFFNPAGISLMENLFDVSFSTNEWIAGIKHSTLSLAFNPRKGLYGVWGFSMQTVDYGDKNYGTVVAANEKGYLDTGEITANAYSWGLAYAKALTDRFYVGGQIRWTKQDFGDIYLPVQVFDSTYLTDTNYIIYDTSGTGEGVIIDTVIDEGRLVEDGTERKKIDLTPLAYDFGTIFQTGYKSLVFGMSVRNFSQEIKYVDDGFQLPLVFTMGISMDIVDFKPDLAKTHSLYFSIDASHYRSRNEELKIGLDYSFMHVLSLRWGYASGNDDYGISYGVGVNFKGLVFDYAYTPFGVWDDVKRMSFRFSF